ncbi:hypothetical protein C1645_815911 [Glomus cerebriforme]|uniref:Uncharacterized protein n=1 Tax=Glomus cerebriforme TaxID=658196 RepID=A0A397TDS3_9GLOM|nr:hypothetical protein C1645_815911 [Glomus cerebriforme]
MEEDEAKLAKLEQNNKEKAKLINCDVGKIKQERVVIDVAIQLNFDEIDATNK